MNIFLAALAALCTYPWTTSRGVFLIDTRPNMIGINEKYTWSPKYQTARSENVHIVLAQSTLITEKSHVAPFSRMVSEPACLLVQILTGLQLLTSSHGYCCFVDYTTGGRVRSESRPNFSHHLYTICAEGIIDSLNSLDVHNWNLVHYVWTCFMSPDWNDTEYWQSWILLDTKFWNLNAQCRWSRL